MNRKETLKELIKRLHEGADPDEVKGQFKDLIKDLTPDVIAQVEEELIKEGMPKEEVQRLCDVHLAVFRESLEGGETLAPEGHPIHILMEEHKRLLEIADELRKIAREIGEAEDLSAVPSQTIEKLEHIVEHLKDSESHYLREENVLFPYLEKYGVTEPPHVMWMEHDQIRGIKKAIKAALKRGDTPRLAELSRGLLEAMTSHFYKENNILYPTALKIIPENEWKDLFSRYIPHWLAITDKKPVEGYYDGGSTLYTAEHLKAWLSPVVWWSLFILSMFWIMLCINIIFRKQWTENEKLSYPIIQLPLALVQAERSKIFKNRMLWLGFSIAAGIDLLNGIGYLVPAVPVIPVKLHDIGKYFNERPLNAMGWTPLSFYPFSIGLSFFMPLDLAFSTWFFYLFRKIP